MPHELHTGHGGSLWFAEESSYGAGTAFNRGLRLVSHSLRGNHKTEAVEDLGFYGAAHGNTRERYATENEVGGGISMNLAYNNASLILLKHLLGAVAEGGGGGPNYTHTFTLAHLDGLGLHMHAISGKAGAGSSKIAESLTGCKIESGTIKVEHGKPVMLDAQIIGKTSSGLVVVSAPTIAASPALVLHHHMGNFAWNSATRKVKSLEISISRGLERDLYLNSLDTAEPVETTPLVCELSIGTRWREDAWDDGQWAETLANATFTFTSGARSMAITCHNGQVIDVSRPVQSRGAIEQTVKLALQADSSNSGLAIVVTNTNSAYDVN